MGVAARQDVPQRERENAHVEPRRPVVDVIQVVLYPLLEIGVAAQIVHLCPTGDARLDQVLLHVAGDLLPEALDEFRPLRPRSHKRHLATKHVDELRQLVEAVSAQERAESRRTLFALTRPYRAGIGFGAPRHRAELEHREALAVPRDALLPI